MNNPEKIKEIPEIKTIIMLILCKKWKKIQLHEDVEAALFWGNEKGKKRVVLISKL